MTKEEREAMVLAYLTKEVIAAGNPPLTVTRETTVTEMKLKLIQQDDFVHWAWLILNVDLDANPDWEAETVGELIDIIETRLLP